VCGCGSQGPSGEELVDGMLGIGTKLKLKCEESQEELDLVRRARRSSIW
jgi:hypothetical protein